MKNITTHSNTEKLSMQKPLKQLCIIAYLLFYSCVFTTQVVAQKFEWAKAIDKSSGYTSNRGFSIDSKTNSYTIGDFSGTIDFKSSNGDSLTAIGTYDVFITKIDAWGNFVWAQSIGGVGADLFGSDIESDALGNTYSVGFFTGTVDFDPGAGVFNLSSQGGTDIFVLKLDSKGSFVWAKRIGSAGGNADAAAVSLDTYGNIYFTGDFKKTVDFEPGTGNYVLNSSGVNFNSYVCKIDTAGKFLWAKAFVGNYTMSHGRSVTAAANGGVCVSGSFQGVMDFDPGLGVFEITQKGDEDIYFVRLDASGNFVWAKNIGGSLFTYCYSIAFDNTGNLYSTGGFDIPINFNPDTATQFSLTPKGTRDIFILKLDTAGNFVWVKNIGGGGVSVGVPRIVCAENEIYIAGSFSGTVNFNLNGGSNNVTSVGGSNTFILRANDTGTLIWVKAFKGKSNGVNSIALDQALNVFAMGSFVDTMYFDTNNGVYELTNNGDGIFIFKLSSTPIGINEIQNNIDVALYPNPSSNKVNISFNETVDYVELTLTDMLGKVVSKKTHKSLSSTEITLGHAVGVYFLTVKTDKGQKTVKLLKE